jgi:hypothetical protein
MSIIATMLVPNGFSVSCCLQMRYWALPRPLVWQDGTTSVVRVIAQHLDSLQLKSSNKAFLLPKEMEDVIGREFNR